MKRMSRMSSDSIESMVQHLVEEKPREQVITEVMSLANELVAMEQEAAAEEKTPQPNSEESAASDQELAEQSTEDEQENNGEEEEIKHLPDAETDVALDMKGAWVFFRGSERPMFIISRSSIF
jgi:hypothetical protein